MKTTQRHEMEKRIRFGSDGNGIFVALSPDAGKTWRHFDDVKAWNKTAGRLTEEQLPSDEYLAGCMYLRGEWSPGQALPRVENFRKVKFDDGTASGALTRAE